MIELGDKVKDTVTGFIGIAVCRQNWIHGCDRIAIQPDKLDKDGSPQEAISFDEPQLVIVKKAVVKKDIKKKKTGGPKPEVRRKADIK